MATSYPSNVMLEVKNSKSSVYVCVNMLEKWLKNSTLVLCTTRSTMVMIDEANSSKSCCKYKKSQYFGLFEMQESNRMKEKQVSIKGRYFIII